MRGPPSLRSIGRIAAADHGDKQAYLSFFAGYTTTIDKYRQIKMEVTRINKTSTD